VSQQPFLVTKQFGDLTKYAILAWEVGALLFVIAVGIAFLVAWLMYSTFKFSLGADSLKIKKGILNKEEIAIPYRQIQDVDLKRDLSFQMLGLSRIIILTAGHEDEKTAAGDEDSEGILPALDKDLAEWLQAELLKRTNVQKVVEEAEEPDMPEPKS
jgi:putative membrane protein